MNPPTATYRLQLREGMTFARAATIVDYLARLGASHVYLSPVFTAAPGSAHGYDVADFSEIDPVLGGRSGFDGFAERLAAAGLRLLLDFVPNHMGATPANPWWRDILEWGRASRFAEHFDIDWSAPRLIVPALAEPYGTALERKLFGLAFDAGGGGISFTYRTLRLPLTPPSYARLLAQVDREPFAEIARRFAVAEPETAPAAKAELAAAARDPALRPLIDRAIAAAADDLPALHDLHEAQVWRIAHWRTAREGLTYRRFFEIADLVGVQVQRPRVFDDVHALLLELVAAGRVDGIRLDHIDGLADPRGYLLRLSAAAASAAPPYLLIEKILAFGETVRRSWPVAGTTGYEFIQAFAELFVDPAAEAAMTEAYGSFVGTDVDYAAMAHDAKRRILTRNLAGELEFLRDLAKAIADRDPATRDYGRDSLRRAVAEFAACFPVYRIYVSVEGPDAEDLATIAAVTEAVKATREVEDEGVVDFVGRMLRLDLPDPDTQGAALEFATRFQQTTSPVMAKALEDTVFYRYNRLIALNEVGGEPHRFGAPVERFHEAMAERLRSQPFGLSATATHDTKRGEDARARLYALSEAVGAWRAAVAGWSAMLAAIRAPVEGAEAPEPEIEWLFYQALAGAWPAGLDPDDASGLGDLAARMEAYLLKVVREAKSRTSWTAPDPAYEDAVAAFVRGAFGHRVFLDDFRRRIAPFVLAGAMTSLAQLAIKLAAPGVADIYQGTEFWDLSLVDPDNRRPPDFAARAAALDAVAAADVGALLSDWRSGHVKLRLTAAGLRLRRDHPALFGAGDYRPLPAAGERAAHLVAFARRHADLWLVLVAPRLVLGLLGAGAEPLVPPPAWANTAVPLPAEARGVRFRDVVTGDAFAAGATLSAGRVLARFPVALLAAT